MKHAELVRVQTTVSTGSASMSLTMVEPKERSVTQTEFMATIRRELAQLPGVRASVPGSVATGLRRWQGQAVEVSVRGPDWNKLIALAATVKADLASSGLSVDLDTDYDLGPPMLAVSPDRPSAADVNVNVNDIATTITALIGGTTVGQYSTAGRRYEHRDAPPRRSAHATEDLELLRVRATNANLVPLSSVTTTAEVAELQSINHANRQRAIRVTGNVAPDTRRARCCRTSRRCRRRRRSAIASCSRGRARSSATR